MRAIDGDRLKRKAQKVATEAWKMKLKASVETILNEFVDWINEAPTIEPEPKTCEGCIWENDYNNGPCQYCNRAHEDWYTENQQRIGKWLPEYGNPSAKAHYCSACNFYYTTDPDEMNYCPHCGAKMERE